MTAIVFTDREAQLYAPAIARVAPEMTLWHYGDPAAVAADVAVSWAPPPSAYEAFPNLRLIHSIGAGVNHILAEPTAGDTPLCRIVDAEQARIMAQYVVWGVLNFHRGFERFQDAQRVQQWLAFAHPASDQCVVGVMGMGGMGRTVATSIAQLGFSVRGWSRSGEDVAGIRVYDETQFDLFLNGTDFLVCLLPLTSATRGILSKTTFSALNRGAYLIQVGRGDHLLSADLRDALDRGQLGGALIDVFTQEPLPTTDPLWHHPKVIVTPHIAAISSSETVVSQIVANIHALHAGKPLANQVQHTRGY